MKAILLILGTLVSFSIFSQSEPTASSSALSLTSAYYQGPRFHQRKSFGIYPEIQMIKSPVIHVSASYARLKEVEWSAFSRGANLGIEFDPVQRFYGPKATVWADMFALFFGLNASASIMYYRQNGHGGLYLRPELGIGIPRIHLKYGYGFKLAGNYIGGFQRHSLTLGCHISIINRY